MAGKGVRTVVVTGASGGVGRTAAVAFGRLGWRVGLLARGRAGLEGAAADVRDAGGEPLAIPVDIADADAVEAAAARVEAELGPVDVWVNVAFSSVFAPFAEISAAEFRRTTEVTYLGYVYGTMAALRRMRERDAGVVVQVSSALAYRSIPLQSAYCGAKHAIEGFSQSVRCELLHERSRVRITTVQLPAVNTPQFEWLLSRLEEQAQPVPPIYQPEVAAEAVVWAARHPRRSYWVGRSTVLSIAGTRAAPGLLDRYLAATGYRAQQTGRPRPEGQPANLWEPADEERDYGAHGAFDDRALGSSLQAALSRHRRALLAAAGAAAGAAAAAAIAVGRGARSARRRR